MRRNDKVVLIILSIAMVVGGLYLLSILSAWLWAIAILHWAVALLCAIAIKIWSIVVWTIWFLAVIAAAALAVFGAFLLWKHLGPPDRPVRE